MNQTFLTRLPRQLVLWAVTCTVCATPSYIWAVQMGEFDQGAMIAGVAVFIVFYTVVASTDWFNRFKKIPGMYSTLCIGYGTRVISALLFPVGMAIDTIPGMISVGLSQAFWYTIYTPMGTGEPFTVTFTATIIQGIFVNLILVIYMLFVFTIAYPVAQSRKYRDGLCQKCGYDLRATTDACPECGEAVPAGHKPGLLVAKERTALLVEAEEKAAAQRDESVVG